MKNEVHIYAAKFPFAVDCDGILPPARAAEIDGCSNRKVREQKYFVWKLLEHALIRSFGLNIGELNIGRQADGKWVCPECCFSLSHSGNLVAAAVSRKSVGVDIERFDGTRFTQAIAEKIATPRELERVAALENGRGIALNALWTQKEAIFKLLGGQAFLPKQIEVLNYITLTKTVLSGNDKYLITVASDDAENAEFYGIGAVDFANFAIQVK